MVEPVLHTKTRQQLDALIRQPSHVILLTGPSGIGKGTTAALLAEMLLELEPGDLANYPYVRTIKPVDRKAIGIETVRDLDHFLSLKIPGSKPIARIAIIENAQLLTIEAQNALLKTLEEPPADTILLLTSSHEQALLPTIRSRVHTIHIVKPGKDVLQKHFEATADSKTVNQALVISGSLPGLTAALLDDNTEHPLVEAVSYARDILQKSQYERLLLVDELTKRKDLAIDICYVLGQMAQLALANGASKRWQNILAATYAAEEALGASGQPKLVLTNLMLSL